MWPFQQLLSSQPYFYPALQLHWTASLPLSWLIWKFTCTLYCSNVNFHLFGIEKLLKHHPFPVQLLLATSMIFFAHFQRSLSSYAAIFVHLFTKLHVSWRWELYLFYLGIHSPSTMLASWMCLMTTKEQNPHILKHSFWREKKTFQRLSLFLFKRL
jgi:hypothetical protein